MRRGILVAGLILAVLVAPALARATGDQPVYDERGQLVEMPLAPGAPVPAEPTPARLTNAEALRLFYRNPKVAHWLARYDPKRYALSPTNATFDEPSRVWNVQVFQAPAGEIAMGKVDDATGKVTEAWTGPQVAWTMARCQAGWNIFKPGCGAFGGTKINTPWLWLIFMLVFVVGLMDVRRPFSLRTLDLLMLVGPTSASLWCFNNGHIFASGSLYTVSFIYLVARMLWIGFTGRSVRAQPVWPTWLLVAVLVFLGGFRIGLNVLHGNVIDVGYSGVIGAQRIVHDHQAPYGHFPEDKDSLQACGPADAAGHVRRHIQTNGRCEDANPLGDTYGPVAYESYIPGYLAFGWSGRWDSLPAARATSIAFDLLCALGLMLVGKRFGGLRLAAILGFAWMAFPFTQYVSSSNTNDAIPAAFLLFGVWLMHRPALRGAFGALAGWTKFAPLVVAPLWLAYPDAVRSRTLGRWLAAAARRPRLRRLDRVARWVGDAAPGSARRAGDYLGGFVIATGAAFSVLLFEPSFVGAVKTFWRRTVEWQMGRDAPFSVWDWAFYHAGLPDFHVVQRVLQVALVVLAIVLAFVPRRRSPLQLVALTAALLVGFELVLTYWLYTYIAWFFPFVAIALLSGPVAPESPPPAAPAPAVEEPAGVG